MENRIPRKDIQKSIQEIFELYKKRHIVQAFTLESVSNIFDIGNEVFMRNNPEEIEPMVKTLRMATHIVYVGLIAAMLLLIVMGTRTQKNLIFWLMILVPMALPLFFVIDYSAWLWWYGHTLNDMGAFAVKPFMPTVFGEGKVAQFATFSYPSIGFGLMLLNSVLLAAIALIRRKESLQ